MKLLALLGAAALAAGAVVGAAPASAQHRGHGGHGQRAGGGHHGGHGYRGGGYRRAAYGGGPRWRHHYRRCRVVYRYHHPVRRCW